VNTTTVATAASARVEINKYTGSDAASYDIWIDSVELYQP
jgi:hypothetical protein